MAVHEERQVNIITNLVRIANQFRNTEKEVYGVLKDWSTGGFDSTYDITQEVIDASNHAGLTEAQVKNMVGTMTAFIDGFLGNGTPSSGHRTNISLITK